MLIFKHKLYFCVALTCLLFALSNPVKAQNLLFSYEYKLDLSNATEAPEFNGVPDIEYPEAARKNGVEGTLKLNMTLGEDGKVKDITAQQDLPFGVTEAVSKALQQWRFQPAKRDGQPIAVKMFFEYKVSATYASNDSNVKKPKIISQPAAIYPANLRSEGHKGKVAVTIACYADGTLKVMSVNSTMPKEFDKAAFEAAKNIKFEPAIHKKSKKPVSQAIIVEYDFKP